MCFNVIANREFLNLLGSLAHYFPNAMKEKAGRIIHQVLHDLETEVEFNNKIGNNLS